LETVLEEEQGIPCSPRNGWAGAARAVTDSAMWAYSADRDTQGPVANQSRIDPRYLRWPGRLFP